MRKLLLVLLCLLFCSQSFANEMSAFFPPDVIARIRSNVEQSDWGKQLREQSIEQAKPWREMTDDQLWSLMFGGTLPRSWMVYSNGTCPACGKPVPMYDWKIDALKTPWKLRCPHCQELFPKNDFKKFYDSGLDEHGIFDPKKANRELLYNTDHPDPKDPLHTFGVDDGTGYARGNERWRFIPTYLVFGQWKQVVHMGINRLTTAYLLTGDESYAHKAAIILDRVADVYPTFDFKTQGLLYETVHGDGYVSVWHDATIETREEAQAYDALKPVIQKDSQLAKFLTAKSEQYKTPIAKRTNADIAKNIEERILKDAMAHQNKIFSNYPQQFLTMAVIETALGWPANREKVFALLDPVLEKATAVDGVTGEKGMANYSCYAVQRIAEFLGNYSRMDQTFLPEMIRRHPRLPQMWRFFIDTWCGNQKYYPLSGDTMHFAAQVDLYAGVTFREDQGAEATGHNAGLLAPSMYSFLWQLYKATNDPAFAQVIYKHNKQTTDGLPYDLFIDDPAKMRHELQQVIDKNGSQIALSSVNKQQWHLGILRSGHGDNSREAWLDYDSGTAPHSHHDGLNLGLFANGLDLMPDFGYPPVQFGGWSSERAHWYVSTAAHNTVLINSAEQGDGAGSTSLWASGDGFSAMTATAPQVYAGVASKYERTVAIVDTSDKDSYVVDIFRVAGGAEHDKFFLSHFGTIEPSLKLEPANDYAHPEMRNFKVARNPAPGWSVTWKVNDHYHYLPAGADVRVRYTDFTNNVDAYTCEAWVVAGEYNSTDEQWVPRVMTRHKGTGAIETNYVSIIEPFDGKTGSLIKSAKRLMLPQDSCVALRVDLTSGENDLLISNDSAKTLEQADEKISTDAKLVMVRRDVSGKVIAMRLCEGSSLKMPGFEIKLSKPTPFIELRADGDGMKLIHGEAKDVTKITLPLKS